jgi:KUP system potassium uptake protein
MARIAGTGVFVSPDGDVDARAFVQFASSRGGVPQRVIFVRFDVAQVPHVPLEQQAAIARLEHGALLAQVRFGFQDEPDVPRALQGCRSLGLGSDTQYYLSLERLAPVQQGRMARWRKWLFMAMTHAGVSAIEYLHLPLERTTLLS